MYQTVFDEFDYLLINIRLRIGYNTIAVIFTYSCVDHLFRVRLCCLRLCLWGLDCAPFEPICCRCLHLYSQMLVTAGIHIPSFETVSAENLSFEPPSF